MRIGTMFLGKVEELDEESIQTKFFILGVPLIPLSSHYVLLDRGNGVQGFEIPLHGKSVLLGYMRIFAWIGALIAGVFAYIERHDATTNWIICAVLLAAAVGTTFFLGGLPPHEKLRRATLKEIAGVGAPPELLPGGVRKEISQRLLDTWQQANEDESWDAAAEAGKADPLLFTLAAYHGREDLARRVLKAIARDV